MQEFKKKVKEEFKDFEARVNYIRDEVLAKGIDLKNILDAYIVLNRMNTKEILNLAEGVVDFTKMRIDQIHRAQKAVDDSSVGKAQDLAVKMRADGKIAK